MEKKPIDLLEELECKLKSEIAWIGGDRNKSQSEYIKGIRYSLSKIEELKQQLKDL